MNYETNILVTGHRGMVGSAIVRRLKYLGYTNVITVPKEKLDLTKPYIDETSVTKILVSIHEKLKTLIDMDGLDLEENENINNSGEINKEETDQQELF